MTGTISTPTERTAGQVATSGGDEVRSTNDEGRIKDEQRQQQASHAANPVRTSYFVPRTSTAPIGLKEWAVAVRALDAGEQLLILRKGGIDEKQFLVEHEEFFLYPTYEHQQFGQMQPRFHDELTRTLAAPHDSAVVAITNWARVGEAYPIADEALADALAAHTLWTPEYIRDRLRFRPKKPLYAMLLRVYRLREPRAIPYLPAYGGCKSWLELDASLAGAAIEPVLSDEAFAERAAPVRALFAGVAR